MDIDVRKALETIDKELKAKLTPEQINLATARALNRAIAKTKTLVGRAIRAQYNMKAVDLSGKMITKKASRGNLSAELQGSTRTATIGRFVSNVQAWRAGSDPNFEAEILRGDTKMLPSGLFVNPKNGLIMGKGSYSGGKFVKDKSGKLQAIKTVSPYASAINDKVQETFGPDIEAYYQQRLLHEIKYLLAPSAPWPND